MDPQNTRSLCWVQSPVLGWKDVEFLGWGEGFFPSLPSLPQVLLPPPMECDLVHLAGAPQRLSLQKKHTLLGGPAQRSSGRLLIGIFPLPWSMHACVHTHRHTQIETHTHTCMSITVTHTDVCEHTYIHKRTHTHTHTAPRFHAPCFQHHCCLGLFLPTPGFQLTWL